MRRSQGLSFPRRICPCPSAYPFIPFSPSPILSTYTGEGPGIRGISFPSDCIFPCSRSWWQGRLFSTRILTPSFGNARPPWINSGRASAILSGAWEKRCCWPIIWELFMKRLQAFRLCPFCPHGWGRLPTPFRFTMISAAIPIWLSALGGCSASS